MKARLHTPPTPTGSTLSDGFSIHRPRNVGWKRAAALLYGDWGTSKAYVIGLAFVAAQFSSMWIIVAVSVLTAVVGYMYSIVCKHFPDGGGVYSAAREQSRLLASIGALLLVAGFTVTAAISAWAALSYLKVPGEYMTLSTMGVVALMGAVNFFGPKHSGSLAVGLALPTVIVVVIIIALSTPHLDIAHIDAPLPGFNANWIAFVGVILALSGVEAVANMTGVMLPDRKSAPGRATVVSTSRKTIFPVAAEVVLGTVLLGWAMLSVPRSLAPQLIERKDDMLRFLGEHYAGSLLGPGAGSVFGLIVGIVFALLLLSAVNTAIVAMISVLYMMAQDGEMPRGFAKLNSHGVPFHPLVLSVLLPAGALFVARDLESLANLYAIGVVGAIAVNMGACSMNKKLPLRIHERSFMLATFLILAAVEITIAKTKPEALFFAVCVLGAGMALRAYSHKLAGLTTLTITRDMAQVVSPDATERLRPRLQEGQKIMVAARGLTPVLRFAMDEALLRKATLCVLYVKEIAVSPLGPAFLHTSRWQDDPHAAAIMTMCLKIGEESGVSVVPVYATSENPPGTILDLAATLGVDYLLLGASQRAGMAKLLKGDVVTQVATGLPEDIQLIIHG